MDTKKSLSLKVAATLFSTSIILVELILAATTPFPEMLIDVLLAFIIGYIVWLQVKWFRKDFSEYKKRQEAIKKDGLP